MTEIQLPEFITNVRQATCYDRTVTICDFIYPDVELCSSFDGENGIKIYFPNDKKPYLDEADFLLKEIESLGLPRPDITWVRAQHFLHPDRYLLEYESLVGYLHMYFEYLGLSNTRFTNLDSGKVNLETFLSDYTSTVEDPDNHYEEIIGDFRTQKEADVRRIFKGVFLDIESVPLPEEQTIYMMLFNYKEARIYYEFLQHWYHYDKKLELDKPWYQIISELANVPSLLRGIRNHIYDKKYQTIIQKYSGLLSSIFSNENFISGLTTLVDDQDLKNSINDLENLIRRQETDENGNIIEIFPKEAISPEPIDYIECIVLYPNQYPATKQTIKDIVTEINELPDHGVQNGDLLLTIALIKIWNSGKRWLLPNEVYDTIMEFVKQLQAKKLTDCNALRDEKIFPEVHQMLQTFSNSWGQTKVFWSRQISAELATKQIMIGNTELKQRAQDYTKILLNFTNGG